MGKTGVERDGAPVNRWSPTGCARVCGNSESASPHLGAWVLLSGWSSNGLFFSFRAPRFAQRCRGRKLRQASARLAERQRRVEAGQIGLATPTHAGSPSRAHNWRSQQVRARAQRFDRKFPPQSLAGTPVFKQIRHTVPFCAKALFSSTVHGAFSFPAGKENGGCIPRDCQPRCSLRPNRYSVVTPK